MRWHPTLAGVFVSVLSSGRAELWDVCHSLLEPVTVFVKEGIVCSCFDLFVCTPADHLGASYTHCFMLIQ